jgi:hypothetical protein
MEDRIRVGSRVELVGDYHPSAFKFKGHVPGRKPEDFAK